MVWEKVQYLLHGEENIAANKDVGYGERQEALTVQNARYAFTIIRNHF